MDKYEELSQETPTNTLAQAWTCETRNVVAVAEYTEMGKEFLRNGERTVYAKDAFVTAAMIYAELEAQATNQYSALVREYSETKDRVITAVVFGDDRLSKEFRQRMLAEFPENPDVVSEVKKYIMPRELLKKNNL